MSQNRIITVQGVPVGVARHQEQDYISLTDMGKGFDGGSGLIEQWLKKQGCGSIANSSEFEGVKNEADRNSFFRSAPHRRISSTKRIAANRRPSINESQRIAIFLK